MDFVYLVRTGARNEQLRYSLRSLALVPHDRVWLVGYRPPWVVNVGYIAVPERHGKWHNLPAALITAARHSAISDTFAYWNDDMYALREMSNIPTYHRGPLREHGHNAWTRGMVATRQLLQRWGIARPLSYETHTPLVMDRAGVIDSLGRALAVDPFRAESRQRQALMYRSAYANVAVIGGELASDIKVMRPTASIDMARDFASTCPKSFAGLAGREIHARFPLPSPYERT